MLIFAMVILGLTAVGGLYLISYVLQNKNTPKGVALIHGSMAALGILCLVIYSFYHSSPMFSIVLFVLAAMGGFVFMYRDITGKSLPKWLILSHGVVAISGLIFLGLFMVFNS